MDTETAKEESSRVAEDVPTVIAKKPQQLSKEEQNAAEIARLAKWAKGDCGTPILPD